MFQSWRFKLREAEQAFRSGRLDEAYDKLSGSELMQFLPGKRLAARLAGQLTQRARQHCRGGDLEAAWRDRQFARQLVGQTEEVVSLQQSLTEAGLREVKARLGAGDPAGANKTLDQLQNGGAAQVALAPWREAARRLQSAANLCRRGKFAPAEAQLAAAQRIKAEFMELLEPQRQKYQEQQRQGRELTERLHEALGREQWSEVVAVAEELLERAPDCRLAREARRRAWAEVGANFVDSQVVGNPGNRTVNGRSEQESHGLAAGPPRLALWIDGVGGYLVCLSDEVMVGQSAPCNPVDVPILGDLSRRHVKICREGEGYSIEALHRARVNGRAIQNKILLSDGDEIELGTAVRLRFRRPHVLSASARLDFLSHHAAQPSADGVLLMADSCVLGPKWQNHVVCRDWSSDLVLYRQGSDLYCRAMEPIEIDGQFCDGRGPLGPHSRVLGSDFSLSVEALDGC